MSRGEHFSIGLENPDALADLPRGARVGLLTNDAATTSRLVPAVDVLFRSVRLCVLFGPEHGIRGDVQAGESVGSSVDLRTGLPVYSLYGEYRSPTPEQLSQIDVLVADLPDVGSRYYTYLSTLGHVMESCAAARLPLVVLDRPNPLGGTVVEGSVLRPQFASFVGRYPVPARHGLTVGEYARFVNEAAGIGCDLRVVPMSGWNRTRYFDELPLHWVMPSPNLPTLTSALLYVGTCLFEGTNVSEGRGTTRPFELIGAPWLDPDRVLAAMDPGVMDGTLLRECRFRPVASKHAGELCAGFQIHVNDRTRLRPYRVAVALLDAIRRTCSDFRFLPPPTGGRRYFIDLLSGDDALRDPDFELGAYLRRCDQESVAFAASRRGALLYPEEVVRDPSTTAP
ncbi:MAG: DUF1343 domain-containing protein [Spirochaetaceae bacterium]|nr:MAG: DUF1343 domain-containing protein [Spirochaetaceae bacterium]